MEVVFDLSGLPSQLLRHIAVCSNEVDIPHVRATCRELRAAMDDPTFREEFAVVLTPRHLSSSSLARIMRSRLMRAVTCLDVRTLEAKLSFIPPAGFQLPHLQHLLFHIQHKSFAAKLGTASPRLTRVTVAGAPEDNQTQALLSFPHVTSLAVNAGALRRPDVFKQLGRQLVHLDLHGSWIQTGAQRLSLVLLTQLTGLVCLSVTKEALQAAGALQLPSSLQHVEGQSGSFALLPGLLTYRLDHLTSLSFWLPLPTPGAPTSLAPLGCLQALQALTLIAPIASEIQVRLRDLAPLTACSRLTSLTTDVLLVPSEEAEAASAAAAGGAGQGGAPGSSSNANGSSSSSTMVAPLAFSNSSSSRRSLVPLTSLRRLDVGHLGYLRSDFPLSTPFPHITHLVWSEFEDLGDPSPPFNDQVDLLSGLTGLRQLDTNMACVLRLLRHGALVNGALTGLKAVRLETVLPEGIEDLFPALPLLPGLTSLELYTWERHTRSWEANYRQEEDLNLWHLQANLRSLKLRASHIVGGLFSPDISAPALLTSCLPQLSELVFEDCEALTADLLNQLLFGLSRARAAAEGAASWEGGCPGGTSSSCGGGGGAGEGAAMQQHQEHKRVQSGPAAAAAAGAAAAAAAAAGGSGGNRVQLAPLCVRVTGTHQLGDEARRRLVRQASEDIMTAASSLPQPLEEDAHVTLEEAAAAAAAAAGVGGAGGAEAAAGEAADGQQLPQQQEGQGPSAPHSNQQLPQQQQQQQQQQPPQQRHSPSRVRGELAVVGTPLAAPGPPGRGPPPPPPAAAAAAGAAPGASSSQCPAAPQQGQQGPSQQQQQCQQLGSPVPCDVRTPSPQQELLLQQLRQHMRLLDEGRGLQQQQQAWQSQQGFPDQPPSKRHHISPRQGTQAAALPAAAGGGGGGGQQVEGTLGLIPGDHMVTQQASSTPVAAAAGGGGGAAAAAGGGGGNLPLLEQRPGTPIDQALGVAALHDRYYEGFYIIRPGLWLEVAPQVPWTSGGRRPDTPQG